MEQKRSILIVDDNADNLQVLGDILEQANFAVRPALSGEIALRAIGSSPPDLILLDIRMPEMDGYEVCRRILANEQTQQLPIIFISAMQDIESKLMAFKAGGLDYITKPFQHEEVLARVNTQLELSYTRKALSEANEHLHTMMDQLVQSEKLKSLGSLAAGVAHELNTPIGNAMLTASTIDSISRDFLNATTAAKNGTNIDELVSTCSECATLVMRNLERASKLVKSFREMAVDQTSERRRKIVLRDCVDDVIGMMKFSLKKTPHNIANTIDPELIIETYPGRVEQILDNLICNAILHGFDGIKQGTVSISAHRISAEKFYLTVSDNGNGIPEENLKRVFDPFFTTSLGQGSSGLGLHIVYNLVTNVLGGSINVSSQSGEGTTFSLTLPMIAPGNDAGHS